MIKRVLAGLIVFVVTLAAFAQTETLNDSMQLLPRLRPEILRPARMDHKGFILPDPSLPPKPSLPRLTEENMTLRISVPEYTPYPWPASRLGAEGNPFIHDYNLFNNFIITDKSYLSTYSFHNTYPTMGTFIEAGATYTYRLNGRWKFSGGMYTTKYTMPSFNHGSQFDAGFDASATFRINDHLRIRGFGQYSIYGERNAGEGCLTPIAPQSGYGVVMEWRINDRVEIHGGVERSYNPMKRKWETTPIFQPVIHLKRKKK